MFSLFIKYQDKPSHSDLFPSLSLFLTTALVMFLFTMTFAGFHGAKNLSYQWRADNTEIVILQIPNPTLPLSNNNATNNTLTTPPQRVDVVLNILKTKLPQNTNIHLLQPDQIRQLLTPWIDTTEATSFPLPAIIEIRFPPHSAFPPFVQQTLKQQIPDIIIERNSQWNHHLQNLSSSLLFCSRLVLIIVGIATLTLILLCAHSTLTTCRETITLLHHLGASDAYVAGCFAHQTARIVLCASIVGIFAASLLLFFFYLTTPQIFALSNPSADHLSLLSTDFDIFSLPLLLELFLLLVFIYAFCWIITQIFVRSWLRYLP